MNNKDKLFHEVDEETLHDFNQGYELLRKNKIDDAADIFHKYLPVTSGYNEELHYALYQLEQVQYFPEEYLGVSENSKENKFINTVSRLIDLSYKKNKNETNKLLKWFKEQGMLTHSKLRMSESGMNLIINQLSEDEDSFGAYSKQLIDAYKDKFELGFFLIFLANLILIKDGKIFSDQPFREFKLKHNDRYIFYRGDFKKGLASGWVSASLKGHAKLIFNKAYKVQVRNIGGHNDYVPSLKSKSITTSKGIRLKTKDVEDSFWFMQKFQMAILVVSSIKKFEYGFLGEWWPMIGIMDWHFDKKESVLYLAQYFGNYDDRKIISSIRFYTPPIEGKEHTVSIALNGNSIVPYDQRIIAGDGTLEMLLEINKLEKLSIVITAVAPMLEPFVRLDQKVVDVMGVKMLPTNQHKIQEVRIVKESLGDVINTLQKTLPSERIDR